LNLDTYQSYSYNSSQQLSKIQRESSSEEKAECFYDSDGRLTKMTYGTGAQSEYGYNGSGALTKISHYIGSMTKIASVAYGYDAAGNVTQAVLDDDLANPGDATVAYQYDNLHRLTREYCTPAEGSGRLKYGYQYYYDAVGNRTKMEEYKPYWNEETEQYDWLWKPTSYEYSSRNELTKVSQEDWSYDWDNHEWYLASSGECNYTYDLRGNLTKKGSVEYYWDSQDHMTKVVNGGTTVQYKYDLLGRRVAKKVGNGNWRWYFYL